MQCKKVAICYNINNIATTLPQHRHNIATTSPQHCHYSFNLNFLFGDFSLVPTASMLLLSSNFFKILLTVLSARRVSSIISLAPIKTLFLIQLITLTSLSESNNFDLFCISFEVISSTIVSCIIFNINSINSVELPALLQF